MQLLIFSVKMCQVPPVSGAAPDCDFLASWTLGCWVYSPYSFNDCIRISCCKVTVHEKEEHISGPIFIRKFSNPQQKCRNSIRAFCLDSPTVNILHCPALFLSPHTCTHVRTHKHMHTHRGLCPKVPRRGHGAPLAPTH